MRRPSLQFGRALSLGCSLAQMKQQCVHRNERDEPVSIEELRAQMAKDFKRDALKCLRSSSLQLGKASHQIDKLRHTET